MLALFGSFLTYHHHYKICLFVCCKHKILQAYPVYSLPSPKISHFFQKACILLLENSNRNQDLAARYIHSFPSVVMAFRLSQLIEIGNMCVCILTHMHTHMYVSIDTHIDTHTYREKEREKDERREGVKESKYCKLLIMVESNLMVYGCLLD